MGTLLLSPLETSSRWSNIMLWIHITEISWRHSTDASLSILFEIYHVTRGCDVQRDAVTKLLRRLIAG